MVNLGSHDHAFGSMNTKIDPNRVVNSIKENIHANEFKEVSIVDAKDAHEFTPMQWPLFDDGKPVTTNAIGYEVGGYYKRHQESLRQAQAEAERKEEEERLAAQKEASKKKEEETPTVTVEELEAIRNAARNEGHTEGLNKGFEEGFKKGVEQGKVDGFVQGQQEGLEKGYQDGFRQGRDEGFQKGQEAGIVSGNDIVTTQADRFRHLADMLANPLREVDEKVTDEIVYIISRLAKVFLKREIKGDVEFLKYGIEKAIGLLPEAKKGADIVLSENDYALMVAAIGKDYMNSQGWNLQPSNTLEDGDIVVKTAISSAQWRVNDRIDALISDFLVGAADAVASAKKEVIEGAPDYDEIPKRNLIPPRDILGMSERIAKNLSDMAPRPDFGDDFAKDVDGADALAESLTDSVDPDASELQAAISQQQDPASANAREAGAEVADNSSVLGSQEQIAAPEQAAVVQPNVAPQA